MIELAPPANDRERMWQEWAGLAQEGDKQAYNLLLRDIVPFIRGVIAPGLANPDWVDEICQDVLVSVHRSLHTYSPDMPFKPWLSAIISFRRTDSLRKHYNAREHRKTDLESTEFLQSHVTEPAHAGELKDIEKALDTLPDKQREAFVLMKLEGYSAQEVADRMQMSVSAVKVSVHRTTIKLKEILSK